jgi:hypothetical protein
MKSMIRKLTNDLLHKLKSKVTLHVKDTITKDNPYPHGFYFYSVKLGEEVDFVGGYFNAYKSAIMTTPFDYVYCVAVNKHITYELFKKTVLKFEYEWQWLEVRRFDHAIRNSVSKKQYELQTELAFQKYKQIFDDTLTREVFDDYLQIVNSIEILNLLKQI